MNELDINYLFLFAEIVSTGLRNNLKTPQEWIANYFTSHICPDYKNINKYMLMVTEEFYKASTGKDEFTEEEVLNWLKGAQNEENKQDQASNSQKDNE